MLHLESDEGVEDADMSAAVPDKGEPGRAFSTSADFTRLGATMVQVALACLLHQPGVGAVLASSRSPRRVQENAEALGPDPTAVLGEIKALVPR